MKRIEKDILFVLISSFVLTVAWIGFNLYHKWATSTISSSLQIQIKPIEPDFDLKTLEKLKTREKISPVSEAKSLSPTVSPTGTAPQAPTPTQIVPPSPTPEPTQEQQIIDTPTPEAIP